MKVVEKVLLAQRSDGKFLRLTEELHSTSYDYVNEPELAKRIQLWAPKEEDYKNPKPAPYYFENSWRARELWTKDCVMVPYEITTETIAVPLYGE